LLEEEEEEKREENMVQEFKEAKRPNKRKEGDNPTGLKHGRKRAKLEKADDEKVPAGWKNEQDHLGSLETPDSVSFFHFKLNQMLFGLVLNLKNQSHLFLV
jgi:hypothetical protein